MLGYDIVLSLVVFLSLPVCLLRPWIGVLMYTWLSTMTPHRLAEGRRTTCRS